MIRDFTCCMMMTYDLRSVVHDRFVLRLRVSDRQRRSLDIWHNSFCNYDPVMLYSISMNNMRMQRFVATLQNIVNNLFTILQ